MSFLCNSLYLIVYGLIMCVNEMSKIGKNCLSTFTYAISKDIHPMTRLQILGSKSSHDFFCKFLDIYIHIYNQGVTV